MTASTYDIPETILRGYLKNNVLNETNIKLLILMQISTLNNYKWLGNLDGLWHAGHEEVHESSCKINGAAWLWFLELPIDNSHNTTKLSRLNYNVRFICIVFNKCRLFCLLYDFPVHGSRLRSVFTAQQLTALKGYVVETQYKGF